MPALGFVPEAISVAFAPGGDFVAVVALEGGQAWATGTTIKLIFAADGSDVV